jgi:hypothetical protein
MIAINCRSPYQTLPLRCIKDRGSTSRLLRCRWLIDDASYCRSRDRESSTDSSVAPVNVVAQRQDLDSLAVSKATSSDV